MTNIREEEHDDFLDEKRKEIDARLRELGPWSTSTSGSRRRRRRSPGWAAPNARPAGAARTSSSNGRRRRSGTGRRGRPRGSGKRALQAQELVSAKPGITIPELAESMGIQANYLYRVMPGLQKDGKVKKRGKGWHPA